MSKHQARKVDSDFNYEDTPQLRHIKSEQYQSTKKKQVNGTFQTDKKRFSLSFRQNTFRQNTLSQSNPSLEEMQIKDKQEGNYEQLNFESLQDFHLDIMNKIFLELDYQKKGYIQNSSIKWRKVPKQLCQILDVVFRRKKVVNLFDFCYAILDSKNLIEILKCYNLMSIQ